MTGGLDPQDAAIDAVLTRYPGYTFETLMAGDAQILGIARRAIEAGRPAPVA